jgi:excisionase family DNA binding protein
VRAVDGNNQPEAWVDRAEMARILGVSLRTLDRMVANGDIPSVTWGRRTRRFLPSQVVRAFMEVTNRAA